MDQVTDYIKDKIYGCFTSVYNESKTVVLHMRSSYAYSAMNLVWNCSSLPNMSLIISFWGKMVVLK